MPSKAGRRSTATYFPVRPLANQPLLTIENLKSRIQNKNARILPPKYASPQMTGCDGQLYSPSCPCPPNGCCPPPQTLSCRPCPPPMCYSPCPPIGCCSPPQPAICPPCPAPLCYPPPCPPMFCCPQPYYCPYPCMPPPNCCPPPPCLPPCPCPPPCPPCKPPCYDPCKPPGSKCCGAGATLICVPKGRKQTSSCKSSQEGENGPQRSTELPPSYNNCNFYVSELPKGLDPKHFMGSSKGGCSSQRSSQLDDAECMDECIPFCDDEGFQEIKNYPAGDGKVVPPPVGYPGSQRAPWGGGGGVEGASGGMTQPEQSQRSKQTWGNDEIPAKSQQQKQQQRIPRHQTNVFVRDNNRSTAGTYPRSQRQETAYTNPSSMTPANTAFTGKGRGVVGFDARVDTATGDVDVHKIGSGGTINTQKFGTANGGVGTTISYTTGFGRDTSRTGGGRSRSMTNLSRGRSCRSRCVSKSKSTVCKSKQQSNVFFSDDPQYTNMGEDDLRKANSGGALGAQQFGNSGSSTGLGRDANGGGSRSMTNLGGHPLGESVSKAALDKLSKYQGQGGTILKVIQPNDDDANRFKGEGGGGTSLYPDDGGTTTILPPPGNGRRNDGRFWLPQTPEMICKPKKRRRPNFVPLCKTCLQNYKGAPEFDDCGLPAPQPNSRGGGFLHGRSATPGYN